MLEGNKSITSDFPLSFLFLCSFSPLPAHLCSWNIRGQRPAADFGENGKKKRRSDTNLATLFRKKSNCLPLVRQKRISVQMLIHALSSKEYSQSIHNFLRPVSTRTKILHEKDGGTVVVHKNEVIWLNYQSSCGIWPAPSINLSFTALGFPFWNSSATAWGRYLSAIPQARSIGLSHLKSREAINTRSPIWIKLIHVLHYNLKKALPTLQMQSHQRFGLQYLWSWSSSRPRAKLKQQK